MKFEDYKLEIPDRDPVSEENFDIETWREENPIDYLKALHLIAKQHSIQKFAFDTIFKVLKLYLPNILYKYYSLNENMDLNNQKFETIKNQNLSTAETKALNDTFESKAFYYDPNKLMKFKPLDKVDGHLIDDFSDYVRIASLTGNGTDSMPMWAHYANNHKGFCVSYDLSENINLELRSVTFPVQYTNKRIDITSIMEHTVINILNRISSSTVNQIMLDDMLMIYAPIFLSNIKHDFWNYENEFRITVGNDKNMKYINAIPKAFFLGIKCEKKNRERLQEIAVDLKIPVYEMFYDDMDDNFKLSKRQIYPLLDFKL